MPETTRPLPLPLTSRQEEFRALERQLADPAVTADSARYRELTRRYAALRPSAQAAERWAALAREEAGLAELLGDAEMAEMARAELAALEPRWAALEAEVDDLLIPVDPNDSRNAILELTAGTGGTEAALFAAELVEMYRRYAVTKGFKVEVLDASESDLKGLKSASLQVSGGGAYGAFKYEAGVHRVQRVPETEAQGRIHTSTVGVSVLPEAEEVDVQIDPAELRIDVMRSSGHGGQGVNTTDSAVRVLHLPTGMIVSCQNTRSQLKNREFALRVLRSRLLEMRLEEEARKRSDLRRKHVGTGDRSEKIRTYNFPQSRVTDHRINLTTHDLPGVLAGGLDALFEALRRADRDLARESEAAGARR